MAEKNEKEQQMQEKYLEFQLLERQMKQVQGHLEQIEQQLAEMVFLQQSLVEMKGIPAGKELFVPIGSGIFVNAALKNNQEVLVNVGSGVVVKKSFDAAAAILDKHRAELQAVQDDRAQKMAELSARAGAIEQELAKFVEGAP